MSKIASSRSWSWSHGLSLDLEAKARIFFNPAKVSKLKRLIFQSRIVFHRKVTKWRNFFDEEFLFCSKIKKAFKQLGRNFFFKPGSTNTVQDEIFCKKNNLQVEMEQVIFSLIAANWGLMEPNSRKLISLKNVSRTMAACDYLRFTFLSCLIIMPSCNRDSQGKAQPGHKRSESIWALQSLELLF